MKKKYKILIGIIVAEFVLIEILSVCNVKIDAFPLNLIGAVIFVIPMLIMLFHLSREESFSKRKRIVFKVLFWHFTVCVIAASIGGILIETGIINF